MQKTNQELRAYSMIKGIKLWQIADRFGVSDTTFSRWMRKPFTEEKAEQFKRYVDEIAADRAVS